MNKKMLSILMSLESKIEDLKGYPKIVELLRGAQREALIELQQSLGGEQSSLSYDEKEEARKSDGKIRAIKMYRDRTKCNLITAKQNVEKWMQEKLGFTHHPLPPY